MGLFNTDRKKNLRSFIRDYFSPAPCKIESMQGDAGLRRYYRIKSKDESYVVMDCPPSYADITDFINIANFLIESGLSAPEILHYDIAKGFMIIEDFGDISLKKYFGSLKGDGQKIKAIYSLIIDLLCNIQTKECPSYFKNFDNVLLAKEVEFFILWYVPYKYNRKLTSAESDEFTKIWRAILAQQDPMPTCLVLRDYHVENMMYLEDRQSLQKIGLLDFQDALCGSPVYDLVSLLEDARIDVRPEDADQLIDYFAQKKQYSKELILRNYHILGAQRNSRILGVFARKYLQDRNEDYLKYIPRVEKYLNNDLLHPDLAILKTWLSRLET